MPSSCPSCGEAMEFRDRSVVLRAGTCPSCQKEFAFVEGASLTEHLEFERAAPGATPVGAPVRVAKDAPECEACGSPLSFRAGRAGAILAECSDCETSTVLRPESEEGSRGWQRSPRAREGFSGPRESRSRPCRQCGAPLRFSTGADGLLVGECDSCGNRFTLPPRAEGPRDRGGRNRPSYGRRPFGSKPSGRGPFRDRRGGDSRPDRRRRASDRSEDDEDTRRRPRRP